MIGVAFVAADEVIIAVLEVPKVEMTPVCVVTPLLLVITGAGGGKVG